jgi:hypothetical protein
VLGQSDTGAVPKRHATHDDQREPRKQGGCYDVVVNSRERKVFRTGIATRTSTGSGTTAVIERSGLHGVFGSVREFE